MVELICHALTFHPAQILLYEAEKITLSSDWSQWRPLIEQFKKEDVMHKFEFPGGFFHGLLLITDPEICLQLMYERLRRDPLNRVAGVYAGLALAQLNLLDSAEHVLERSHISEFSWFIPFKRGQFSESLAAYEKEGLSKEAPFYTLINLLSGNYQGDLAGLHDYVRPLGFTAGMFYNAVGEYERADSVARVYDAEFLGPTMITDALTINSVYFRLSATPNFSARLRELGVDVIQFEKEHYRRFPVVKLKNK